MTNIEYHKTLCEQLIDTYTKKNADYGDSFSEMFSELGVVTAITRIGDKYNRFKTLALKNEMEVVEESIIDTLMDMANYCIMTVMELNNELPF